jgi:hypothetical protein
MDSKQKFTKDKKMKLPKKGNAKEDIIKMYTDNLSMSSKDIAFQVGTNLEYTEECLEEYLNSLVAYYDMGIAPSMNRENVFFLFSDNGTEKELHKEGNVVHSEDNITELERLFIRINLGCETIFITTEKNSKK